MLSRAAVMPTALPWALPACLALAPAPPPGLASGPQTGQSGLLSPQSSTAICLKCSEGTRGHPTKEGSWQKSRTGVQTSLAPWASVFPSV